VYLGNPLLPINITALSAAETIKKKLEAKNWQEYELGPLKLNLLPYFLYNYYYYVEDNSDGKKTVKNTVNGVLALDGHAIEIREDLVELLKHNWKKTASEVPRGEFYEKWCNIEKREQDKVLQLSTAEYFGVPEGNVFVSNARKMMVPFYKTTVVLEEINYPLVVNAIDGSVEGIKEIPERQKGYLEITKETVNELKHPSAWIKYSKEALTEGTGTLLGKNSAPKEKKTSSKKKGEGIDLSFLDSKWILVLLMLLGLLLIFAGLFRVKPF